MMTWAIDLWNSKREFCGIDAKSIGYKVWRTCLRLRVVSSVVAEDKDFIQIDENDFKGVE
jgi:hypothetical protein